MLVQRTINGQTQEYEVDSLPVFKREEPKPYKLKDRELKITILVTEGLKNKEIAGTMGTTEHVIKNYLRCLYDQLGLDNRVQLAMWYIKNYET